MAPEAMLSNVREIRCVVAKAFQPRPAHSAESGWRSTRLFNFKRAVVISLS
jgi:hypothetical protein